MQNNPDSSRQIKTVAELTGLNDFVIEKDWYVTKAIGIVSKIKNDLYDLVFQGGTSLAKAHGIIERMSEDCDFRIRLKSTDENQSKSFRRKILREFRHDLVTSLRAGGFEINDDDIRVRNEGQFMNLRTIYPSLYPLTAGLKPFIALEFFLGDVKIEPERKSITTLIQTILGDDVAHPHHPMLSVAIIETAAEKWVGLTRRVATSKYRRHYRDPNLVRHLYDLYQINQLNLFDDRFNELVGRIILDDRQHYKNHNDDYYRDPVSEIKRAIDELEKSKEWHDNWQQFLGAMVFAEDKPSYRQVLNNLQEKTDMALAYLEHSKFLIN